MKKIRNYQQVIGETVEHMRLEKGWTQEELAKEVGTSQSAIHRIEKGGQNVSLEMIKKLSEVFGTQILSINDSASQSFRVRGGKELRGEITINTSKNAAVGLLCASLLNNGRTVLRRVARIEEVFRIIEVLESIGFRVIDFTYAEPIENSFSFSGIRYEADNVIIFMGIALVFFVGCMVFVRRDKTRPCSVGDKLGIVLNVLVAVVVIPFISFFCILFGIVESSKEWVNQTIYNIPPFMILCLALSVVFRRKGYGKAGLLIQLVGLLPCIFAFVIG